MILTRVRLMTSELILAPAATLAPTLALALALSLPLATATAGRSGLRAAQDAAAVFGVVEDPLGTLVPGVLVTLRHRSGAVQTVTTRTDGAFRFDGLPAGRYDIDLSSPGFEELRDEVTLETGGSAVKTMRLQIGGVAEYLTVAMTEPARNEVQGRGPVAPLPDPCARKVVCVRPPRKTVDARPRYPAAARASGLQGTVIVEATIGTTGVPDDVKAVTNPNRDLVDATMDAIREWRFQPAQLNGIPVEAPLTVTVEYVDAVAR